MTVISRKQQNYDYSSSGNVSDTDTLHLTNPSTSDVESEHGEASRPCTFRIIRIPVFGEFGLDRFKRNSGKRKQRQFKNRLELQTLVEEAEDTIQFVKLMDDYKSPFARLMEDASALKYWNEFTALPEEEQGKLTEFVPRQVVHVNRRDDPLMRISSKIKRAMKIKKNLPMEMVQKVEDDLIRYFSVYPQGVYRFTPITSFERLLLHAIAQYHNLKSISVIEDLVRIVEVHGSKQLWAPMEMRFCDFIEKLRQ